MNDRKGIVYGIGAILLVALGWFALRGGGGLLGFLGKAALWGIGIVAVVVIAIVVLVIILAMRGRKGEANKSGADGRSTSARNGVTVAVSGKDRELLSTASRALARLRMVTLRVNDKQVRELSSKVCERSNRIISTLREKPEAISKARQFLSYYLPTLGEIVEKYAQMEAGGVAGPEITQMVMAHLRDIQAVAEKQYANLFEADILDLTVEMEVMTMSCKREGLLSDGGVAVQTGDGTVSLTL